VFAGLPSTAGVDFSNPDLFTYSASLPVGSAKGASYREEYYGGTLVYYTTDQCPTAMSFELVPDQTKSAEFELGDQTKRYPLVLPAIITFK